jgi:hypothetical protein
LKKEISEDIREEDAERVDIPVFLEEVVEILKVSE